MTTTIAVEARIHPRERGAVSPAYGVENLRLFCRMGGSTLSDEALLDLLMRAGLTSDQIQRPVDGYSKGMRQKVGLAIAYARSASALLLDEPLSGLDPSAATDFCEELLRIREAGAAVLMTPTTSSARSWAAPSASCRMVPCGNLAGRGGRS